MNPDPDELASPLLALGWSGIELAPHSTEVGGWGRPGRGPPADLPTPPDLSARLRMHRGGDGNSC